MPSVVLLDKGVHNRSDFDSGSESLDRYIRERAASDTKKRVAVCYVLVADEPSQLLGYYTLSSTSVELAELPPDVSKRLPKYPTVPATLLGRLAVDSRQRGHRFGEYLLVDALGRALETADSIGSALVVVDAKDESAARFYERYEFMPLGREGQRYFLSMGTVAKLF